GPRGDLRGAAGAGGGFCDGVVVRGDVADGGDGRAGLPPGDSALPEPAARARAGRLRRHPPLPPDSVAAGPETLGTARLLPALPADLLCAARFEEPVRHRARSLPRAGHSNTGCRRRLEPVPVLALNPRSPAVIVSHATCTLHRRVSRGGTRACSISKAQ